MAGVAKWLRLRFVVSAFAGSTPVICPIFVLQRLQLHKRVGAFCICKLGVYTPNLANRHPRHLKLKGIISRELALGDSSAAKTQ